MPTSSDGASLLEQASDKLFELWDELPQRAHRGPFVAFVTSCTTRAALAGLETIDRDDAAPLFVGIIPRDGRFFDDYFRRVSANLGADHDVTETLACVLGLAGELAADGCLPLVVEHGSFVSVDVLRLVTVPFN